LSEQLEEILSNNAIVDEFKEFLDQDPYYRDYASSLAFADNATFIVDYDDLITYGVHDLPRHFEDNVDLATESLKLAVSAKMLETDIGQENKTNPHGIQVRIKNYDTPILLRSISPNHAKKMICVNAVIAKASEEKPFMIKSVYKCSGCEQTTESQKNTYIKKCPQCDLEGGMKLDLNTCVFTSYRQIVIQDLPEDLPAGQIPLSKSVTVFGSDLTNGEKCRPGSRIKLTAIVRLGYDKNTADDLKNNADPLGILDNAATGMTFSLVLYANNIEALGDNDDNRINSFHTLSNRDIELIQNMGKQHNVNQLLIDSFAPHIFGHEDIKEVLLLAAVGANNSNISEIKKRHDINCLLVGNAGVAKSQLLLFASKISPRAIYLSGRGSSGVGLTAAVVKDEKTGTMMLEAGATVLADQGICIIDEFDKLLPVDRSALHEVMEQQTCSVAKGGIVATLNARVSLLAAANPLNGTYDSYKTLSENTGYPPSMISRFDFIFVIKDVVNEKTDTDIASAILTDNPYNDSSKTRIDALMLSKYLQYVKSQKHIQPKLTPEAANLIKKHYITLRKKSEQDKDGTVAALTVTARLVDTLKRCSIARAKLLQKDKADIHDVNRIIYLLSKMYESFGILISPDPNSPDLYNNVQKIETLNLGLLYGKPATRMNKQKVFFEVIEAMTNSGQIGEVDIDVLSFELVRTRKFVTGHDADDFIRQAIRAGVLHQRKGKIYAYNKDVTMI
jgi:replicative DNA helicase Mcm